MPLPKTKNIHYLLTLLFFILSLIGILHHELWLDEAHHWLLARDSNSIANLISNTRYEGHPILWNLLLYFISRITLNPFWMQFLHILISTTAVFIFLKRAPFSLLFKILFIFGYFMLFEYNLLSRNYALGVLFLFLACNIYPKRKEKFILFVAFLAIASNVHAVFVVISSCLIATVVLEHIKDNGLKISKNIAIGSLIFFLSIVLAAMQIIPPQDTVFFDTFNDVSLSEKFSRSLISFFKGIVTIPDFRITQFWNSNLLVNINKPLAAITGAFTLALPLFLFYKNKIPLFYVYTGIFGAIVFFFVTPVTAIRHHGMMYLILISGLWINHYYPFSKNRFNSLLPVKLLEKIQKSIIFGILTIQLISGIFAYSLDIEKPFTNSKQTVLFLKQSGLSHKLIVTGSCGGTSLSSYLERPIFFTNFNSYQSYCNWGKAAFMGKTFTREMLIKSLENLVETQNETIIFISFKPFFKINEFDEWVIINKKLKYRFIKKFDESIIGKGNSYIFEISRA